jgi:hypothetical protein
MNISVRIQGEMGAGIRAAARIVLDPWELPE